MYRNSWGSVNYCEKKITGYKTKGKILLASQQSHKSCGSGRAGPVHGYEGGNLTHS